jgi:Zn-dependent metalloprotease
MPYTFLKALSQKRLTLWMGALFSCSVITLASATEAQVTARRLSSVEDAIRRMELAAGKAHKVVRRSEETGLVTFLAAAEGFHIPTGLGLAQPEEHTLEFIKRFGAAFGLQKDQVEVVEVSPEDEAGTRFVRLQQIHKGLRVRPAELTVHFRNHAVTAVLARTLGDLERLSIEPIIRADEAFKKAQRALLRDATLERLIREWFPDLGVGAPRERSLDNRPWEFSSPRLEILNRALLEERPYSPRLAWFIEAKNPTAWRYIWVDARTGQVLLNFNRLHTALQRTEYDAGSTATLPGTVCRVEGGAPSANDDCNFAYTYAGDTYNYFFTQHGRDSYDDAGAVLISTVDYCPSANQCPYENAYWDGEQMVYGEGFPAADDVDAHELTHAVTQYSADLVYYKQSGALNESYSDIFGETIDLTNNSGTDTDAVRWLLGEDIPNIGAIRDMMDPTVYGDPGKVSDSQYQCFPLIDNGGVHTNSGVPNHAYALMVDGGTYNGYTITGIGLTKAGKIQYRALTRYLVSGSKFSDNYLALQQSCTDLIGTADISANDCTEVKKALDAVEMSRTPCT